MLRNAISLPSGKGAIPSAFPAVALAQLISRNVTALYIDLDSEEGEILRTAWERWWPEIPLEVVPSPYRSTIQPLLDFLNEADQRVNDGQLATVVLPQFIPNHWWESFLHNQIAWLIKAALLYGSRYMNLERVVIDVPFHLIL